MSQAAISEMSEDEVKVLLKKPVRITANSSCIHMIMNKKFVRLF